MSEKRQWGDYYYGSKLGKKKSWALEIVHSANQAIPSFSEIFDEETFYVFVACFVVCSILLAVFLARCVGVKIREHDVFINRDWGDPTPANPFAFPWKRKKEEERKLEKTTKFD
ncbi:hypothetical protein PMAYCL1PPCAC_21954 [Pristionchus mayeri]|uniref:Uncharacterized protein n=1 Tax=Pristionchus mayeri TaxID=1317129 RepID=A0AAN5CX79_9BILA|nr:hypothetical protein PMAYCL1PPCAC_21954 [Pristionchus mayeri]